MLGTLLRTGDKLPNKKKWVPVLGESVLGEGSSEAAKRDALLWPHLWTSWGRPSDPRGHN